MPELDNVRFLKRSDRANASTVLQNHINELSAAGNGGIILCDSVSYTDPFLINSTVTLADGVHIQGVPPTMNSISNCPDLLPVPRFGTIFKNNSGSAINCFVAENTDVPSPTPSNIVNDSPQINLSHLCFADFTDAIQIGAINRIGLSFSVWEHIYVYNDGGDGIVLYNLQQNHLSQIKMSNTTRGMKIIIDHAECQPGNSEILSYYNYTKFNTDPDYGLLMEVHSRTGYNFAALNALTFIRPQVNCFGGTHGANAGNANIVARGIDHGSGPTPTIVNLGLFDTDTEGAMDHNFNLQNMQNSIVGITVTSAVAEHTTTVKTDNCDYTLIDSRSQDTSTDISTACTQIEGRGVFRSHTADRPIGFYTEINFEDPDPAGTIDVRTVLQLFQGRDNTGTGTNTRRNLSGGSSPTDTSIIGAGVSFVKGVLVDNDGGTLSKDHAGKLIKCGNTQARTFTLPAANSMTGGEFTFLKTTTDAFAITLDPNGSETINGAATNTEMDAQYDTITVVSDGSNWFISSKSIS